MTREFVISMSSINHSFLISYLHLVNTIGIFGVLAGSAVALALFLTSFFLLIKRKEGAHYVWVGLILLAIGLRIGKSIFFFLLNDMAPIGLAIGFSGLASIGPLTLFMVKQKEFFQFKNVGHFVLPVAGTISCYVISPSPWESVLYQTATLILLVYLISAWRYWIKAETNPFRNWDRNVLITVSGVWVALVYQHVSDTMMDYAIGAIIASMFLYWIFFQSFRALSKGITIELPDQTKLKVQKALEQLQLFKQSGMNLQQFSTELKVPSYLVTRAVKQLYDRTFPETLNHFRVEAVKQMLLDPKKEHLKIESLAYEVGFVSPSAFYAAFKKHTGQTPTEFQRASLLSA